MKRLIACALSVILSIASIAPQVRAAVNVNRAGDENPVKEVAKSVLYGGLAGLTVGAALAIATENNHNDDDYVRWGFATGTLAGLGIGMWWITSRPSASAALEFQNGRWSVGAPAMALGPDGTTRVRLAAVKF